MCFWGSPPVRLPLLNLVTNAGAGARGVGWWGVGGVGERKKKRSVENLNKYANIVTVINSWHAPINE